MVCPAPVPGPQRNAHWRVQRHDRHEERTAPVSGLHIGAREWEPRPGRTLLRLSHCKRCAGAGAGVGRGDCQRLACLRCARTKIAHGVTHTCTTAPRPLPPRQVFNEQGDKRVVVTKDLPGDRSAPGLPGSPPATAIRAPWRRRARASTAAPPGPVPAPPPADSARRAASAQVEADPAGRQLPRGGVHVPRHHPQQCHHQGPDRQQVRRRDRPADRGKCPAGGGARPCAAAARASSGHGWLHLPTQPATACCISCTPCVTAWPRTGWGSRLGISRRAGAISWQVAGFHCA